jgi:RNA polymerase sigma-70 factor, ECF subfamily
VSPSSPRPADPLENAYRGHATAVFRFALRYVRRRDLAEDLTSEAFLALQRHGDTVVPEQLPRWLFRVVKNRAIDHWRRRGTERRHAERAPLARPCAAGGPDGVRALLESPALKPVHRACLLLHYAHGMTRSEVAAHTGLSETQVKGHLQYGLELLRRELRAGGEGRKDPRGCGPVSRGARWA